MNFSDKVSFGFSRVCYWGYWGLLQNVYGRVIRKWAAFHGYTVSLHTTYISILTHDLQSEQAHDVRPANSQKGWQFPPLQNPLDKQKMNIII